MRDALVMFGPECIRQVYVVPNFISEGYFSKTVIPRELELTGPVTERADGQIWNYCEPVGNNPAMTELLLGRAAEIAHGVPASETTLLIVGHGTSLNDNSAVAAKREAEKIRALGRFAEVLNTYMEEPPLIADWPRLTRTRHVVVVPFFISDGLHSYEDIPVLLGIGDDVTRRGESVFAGNPYELHGRLLYYAPAIGTHPTVADLLVEQVQSFDQVYHELQTT